MRKFLKRIFFAIAYWLGIIRLFYWINRRRQRILVFHHIIPDEMENGTFEQRIVCCPQSRFAWLLSLINKRFGVTTEIGLPSTAVITFDDGYRAAIVAADELARYDNKAYFFVPLANVDGGPLWIDRVMAWFAYVPDGEYNIAGRNYCLTSQGLRQSAFSDVIDGLYAPGAYNPDRLVESLEMLYPFSELEIDSRYKALRFSGLRTDEIGSMIASGHKIGGHSVRHDILSLLSPLELKADFKLCSTKVGEVFNCNVYAYPFGHYRDVSENCQTECECSGFKYAVMNEWVKGCNDYKLSRINISGYTSRYEVEAALSGFTQWFKSKVAWIR